ncbi:hypothetical protein BC829DRAFT_411294 [Chytridium lagenaria]|nr:hypothetical protein BC829DRAFT_411294 [Chytridium lagenaria]
MSKAFGKDYGDNITTIPAHLAVACNLITQNPTLLPLARQYFDKSWALPVDAVFYVFKSTFQHVCQSGRAASLQGVIDSLPTHEEKDFLDGCRSTFSELAASWYRLFHTSFAFLNRENETSYSIGLRVGGQLTARTLADDNTVLLRGIIVKDFYLGPVRLMTRRCSNCTDMEVTVVIKEIEDIANHVRVCHAIPLRTGPGKPIVCDHHLLKRECACP